MYPPFHDDCSSEIIQQTIDYGSAVRSSFSKRSSTTPLSTNQNIVSYSIEYNCPSLATNRSMCCQTYPANTPGNVFRNQEVTSGKREVPSYNSKVCSYNTEVCSYNPDVHSYHPEVPPCAPDVCSGDHKCDLNAGPVENTSKQTMTPETSSEIDTNYSSKIQIKHQKKKRLGRIRLLLKLSCFRPWNCMKKSAIRRSRPTPVVSEIICGSPCIIPKPILKEFEKKRLGRIRLLLKLSCFRPWNCMKKSAIRRSRPTPVVSEIICGSPCIIPKPILKEFGTGMKFSPPKTAAIVTSKWLKNLNSKVLRDVAGATSELSVNKKPSRILVSAFTSNKDMMKQMATSKIYLQTGTQITKSPFANHKDLMAKKKTVSFNGGSSEVTKLSSTNQMLKQDCSVMTETLGSGSIRPILLSRCVETRKSTPILPAKFCPSKWADVVVNRIMRQKQLKTQSCGTCTTPVKLVSFSTQPTSFHSSVDLNHHSLKLMSTKSSKGHYNIVNNLGTQNSRPDLPFCSSDLAEKVAKKIIQHMQMKPLVRFDTQERGINVYTDCYMMQKPQPDILSRTSERTRESESINSRNSTKLHTCSSIKNEPVLVCNVQSNQEIRSSISGPPENSQQHSTETNNADTELRALKSNPDGNACQTPKQEIMSESSANTPENSQPSCDSSKLDSSSTLRSKQGHNVFAHAILSCIRAHSPLSESIDGECTPDSKPDNQSRCSSPPRDCDSEDSKTTNGIAPNTATDPEYDEDFGNKVEQLASQIAAEVQKLKTLALKAHPIVHQTSSCETKVKTPTCCHQIVQCLRSEISTGFSKTKADLDNALTQTDCNGITPTAEYADLKPHNNQLRQNFCCEVGINVSKSICPLTTRSVDHKICQACHSRNLVGLSSCQTSNCDCQCTKLVHVLGLSLCSSKSEMRDNTLRTKEIQVPLKKSESTQFIEAVSDDSDCDFSIVQYIGNLLTQKMAQVKCRFNNREEPFAACQAFFRAMQVCVCESSIEQSRHDFQSQTSITKQVPALNSTEVQKTESPPAEAYKPRQQAVWHTKICTIHRERRYESCESRTSWCVRMRQSCLVNHAFSVTNICSGHEREDLRGVYYMLSAIEGRIRRVKCRNRMIS